MEMNYLLITLALIIALSVFCYAFKMLSKKSVHQFQHWEKTDMPYIKINFQGHELNMIADSGASVSIIRKGILSELQYVKSTRNVSLTALDNEGIQSEVVTIPINVGGKEVITDFVVYDNDDIAGFLSTKGILIDGILGVEFFKKTRGKVDFKKQTVTFP